MIYSSIINKMENKQIWKNSVLINPISVVLRDLKDGTGKSESHIDLQNRS